MSSPANGFNRLIVGIVHSLTVAGVIFCAAKLIELDKRLTLLEFKLDTAIARTTSGTASARP